jgi:hypothetical protein
MYHQNFYNGIRSTFKTCEHLDFHKGIGIYLKDKWMPRLLLKVKFRPIFTDKWTPGLTTHSKNRATWLLSLDLRAKWGKIWETSENRRMHLTLPLLKINWKINNPTFDDVNDVNQDFSLKYSNNKMGINDVINKLKNLLFFFGIIYTHKNSG